MAVESRAMCPIRRCFCVAAITASCNCCGSSVPANSAKARENFDSRGSVRALLQPQKRRSGSSTLNRAIRSRVVGRFITALAMNAVASAARSFAGRPVTDRRADNIRSNGASATTEPSSSICRLRGPVAVSTRGNNSSCRMWANCVTSCRGLSCMWGWLR